MLFFTCGKDNNPVMTIGQVNITDISFELYGDVNDEGDIRLRKTSSYHAKDILIPPQIENLTPENLLTTLMESYNTELRKQPW